MCEPLSLLCVRFLALKASFKGGSDETREEAPRHRHQKWAATRGVPSPVFPSGCLSTNANVYVCLVDEPTARIPSQVFLFLSVQTKLATIASSLFPQRLTTPHQPQHALAHLGIGLLDENAGLPILAYIPRCRCRHRHPNKIPTRLQSA